MQTKEINMYYGSGAAMTAGVASGALPLTGFGLIWIIFLGISLALIVVAMVGTREIEEALWRDRGDVELLYLPLKEYVERLAGELNGAKPAAS
jgi:hypothetical protein